LAAAVAAVEACSADQTSPSPDDSSAASLTAACQTADGSTLVAGSTSCLQDSAGTWTFGTAIAAGGNQILLNGKSTAGYAKEILLSGGQIYVLNTLGAWYHWANNSWPLCLTADKSSVLAGSSGCLQLGPNLWTFDTPTAIGGNMIMQDGKNSGGFAKEILLSGGQLYALTKTNSWWEWLNSKWVMSSGAPAPSPAPSPAPTGVTPPSQAAGYGLVFSEDFSHFNMSPNDSGSYTWYNPGNWFEKPAPLSNISVSGDVLDLIWTNGQGTYDTSISTATANGPHYQAWQHFYIEVSMAWDVTAGSWPAIWMEPIQQVTGQSGAHQGEIDIFEAQGNSTFYGTLHDWHDTNGNHQEDGVTKLTADLGQSHTYGLLWTPGQMTWYFDNKPLFSQPSYPIMESQYYYLILGDQEGSNWTYGNGASSVGSLWMKFNWVHIFQCSQSSCQSGYVSK
jgi:hypothetical protein